jgi:hypothetical protein
VSTREVRLAANEALLREVNERINELGGRNSFEKISIVCECADDGCLMRFEVGRSDYEGLRSSGIRFAVVPGHEKRDIESVAERHDTYLVVEKVGVGAELADETDPR